MRVLVTGSEGSLMQAVIPYLLDMGVEVRGVDNFARYGEIERSREIIWPRGDLTNPKFVEQVVEGAIILYRQQP